MDTHLTSISSRGNVQVHLIAGQCERRIAKLSTGSIVLENEAGFGGKRPYLLPHVERDRSEGAHDLRVEMAARTSNHLFGCGLEWKGGAIWPVRSHRVHRIGHREYAGSEAYGLTGHSSRISAAVEALMMLCDDLGRSLKEVDAAQDVGHVIHVTPHVRPLFVAKRAAFEQNRIRHANLAYVVQQGAMFE